MGESFFSLLRLIVIDVGLCEHDTVYIIAQIFRNPERILTVSTLLKGKPQGKVILV